MNLDELNRALLILKKRDKVLARLISTNGFEFKKLQLTPYEALLQSVIYQQLSYTAARATLNRFLSLYGGYPEPERLLQTDSKGLRNTGLSFRKIIYLKEIARYAESNSLARERLDSMKDEEIAKELDGIKGIGPWTIQMILIFVLGRLNVFPSSDLGIRKALKANYNLPKIPDENEALSFSKRWEPYRSVAALVLWRSLDKSPWP